MVSGGIRVLPRYAEALATGMRGLVGGLARRWSNSLQLRVVTTTLVVSGVVVTILGIFLMQQIGDDLLSNAKTAASDQALNGLSLAQATAGVNAPAGGQSRLLMLSIATALTSGDGSTSDFYGVEVAPPPQTLAQAANPTYSKCVLVGLRSCLPASLTAQFERVCKWTSGKMYFTSVSLPQAFTQSRTTVLGLVYGARFGSGYQLYYFFPLTQEQGTTLLVQQTLALVGFALVFLLAGIAWMVTRWVVVPVARAAQGAHRLSGGNLDERLEVRGSDEIAALATAFNEMASGLQEKMRQLEDLSRVQRQFVSDVSHELRTPLTTIRMAADLIYESRAQLEAAAGRAAELLTSQLERFESLLADLLEISRYDANAATLDAEAADVCDLVRHSADVAQQLAERRGARIEFRLPADPCLAEVDRRRVERILRNLLVNAVEHGEGRDVVVTAAADRYAVAIAVRDFGVGLSPGEAHLVFDRFWRADPARARTTGGTGLGLSIALEDARLHGGWLEVWGEPGRGSVFRLTLPRQAGAELAGSPLPLVPDSDGIGDLLIQPIGEFTAQIPASVALSGMVVADGEQDRLGTESLPGSGTAPTPVVAPIVGPGGAA